MIITGCTVMRVFSSHRHKKLC